MYALQRTSDGKYVARSGSKDSYTRKLENAEIFKTQEIAEKNRCMENERIIDVQAMLNR